MLGNRQYSRSVARASALLITVNYKDEPATIDLLTSLKYAEGASRVDVIVADNGSGPKSLAKLRDVTSLYPNVDLVESNANRGYFGAAKFAFDHYLSSGHSLPDWVIVCNHDVIVEDKQFFMKLFSRDSCAVGIIAPRIQVLADGADQNPFMRRRPGRLRWASLRLIYSNYAFTAIWHSLSRLKRLCNNLLKRVFCYDGVRQELREEIYAPHGAFMIFSKRFFDAGGYLDDRLFLYWEEISVSEICRSLRLPVVYEPTLRILHKEHQSVGDSITKFSYDCYKKSFDHIYLRFLAKASFSRD